MFFKRKSGKKTEKGSAVNNVVMPRHVGIIMDGNGRWAKKQNLPRSAGHTAGAQTFRKIARYASDIGIEYLTVYAFSTENWKRPTDEVGALMKLFKSYLNEALTDFKDDDIRIKFLGDKTAFSEEIQELIYKTELEYPKRNGMILNIAMNYGGRDEIVTAVRRIAQKVQQGKLSVSDINESTVSDFMYTAGQPDPDLIIRPSGEHRTSNFLLWQSAYSEYVIMNKLWPDFTTDDFDKAIVEFSKRNRRFGGV